MKKLFIAAVAVLALAAGKTIAQTAPAPPAAREKKENIIIRKNGDSKEKLTIVIDGDNVTINGKPAKDFKDSDVEIIHDNDVIDFLPPMPPHGGAKTFTRGFTIHSNDALLGIMPEDADNGAKITDVTKGSAADKAGLKEDDIIIKIGDKKINNADDVYGAVGKYKPDDKIIITYKRDNKESTVTATLDKNKKSAFSWNSDNDFAPLLANGFNKDFAFSFNRPAHMGARVQDTENGDGVKVIDIDDDDSPAAKAGLKEDDVITQVNGKAISSVKDIKDQLKEVKPGDDIKLQYRRSGASQSATVHIPKPLQTSDL